MTELIVGIDLGTTNSELAVIQDGQVKVLDIHGNPIMPSCVGLDPTGQLIVGQTARNQLVAAPEATILSIKRKMGEDLKVSLGDRQFSPEEISNFVLRELKKEGERILRQPIKKAVITVPAYFNERQRKATQIAGELAGLEVVRILNEPTAAALAYGAGHTEDERMLVYDLGGGTFDVSVVVVEQGVVEVKSSHGDTHLGGDDFDQLLVDFAVLEFKKRHNADLQQDPKALRRLKVALEAAKRRLSDEPYVLVREEYLDGQQHLELEITRLQYEEMITPLLEKTLDCVHKALEDAKLTPAEIDKVMLVGGATRTPLVQQLLHERMKLEPRFEINPDLIVAMGAAVQAGVIAGEKHHSILVDITPHTFSTGVLGYPRGYPELICAPLIVRNTPLPASKADLFGTVADNQTSVEVTAYQGEGQMPDENVLIGKFLVTGLSQAPANNQVVIHFELDLNGLLKVTATEKATGLVKSVVMDTRTAKTVNLEQARRNIADLIGDEPDEDGAELLSGPPSATLPPEVTVAEDDELTDTAELLTTAKDLRKRADLLLQKNINADDGAEIRRLVHESATAISGQNWDTLSEHNDALSDLLFYLED